MPESPDQHFGATITRTLRFGTLVTPRQQENAKERLLCCAASRAPLPALQSAGERATLRDHASVVTQCAIRLLNFVFVDSSAYERARRPPRFYQYYNAHGRYAFTAIPMSA